MKPGIIEVDRISKRFGDIVAVDQVAFTVNRGELFGLIGHNGAGKSTLFRLMLGLLRPDAGSICIRGEAILGPAFRRLRRRIAYLPENVVFYDNLSGLETLRFLARLKGADQGQCLPLLDRVGLGQAAHRPVRGYSKGMRQRLGFAQALLGRPEILFLDEPTTGLDPEGIREFYRMLQALQADGITVVLTSHNLAEIQERVDRLALMKLGRIQALGTVQELRESLDLPLRFQVSLSAGGEPALRRALSAFDRCRYEVQEGRVAVQCDRSQKLAVLRALSGLKEAVSDIQIHEASLEDVFLGYVDA